jgi:hypothetical protein
VIRHNKLFDNWDGTRVFVILGNQHWENFLAVVFCGKAQESVLSGCLSSDAKILQNIWGLQPLKTEKKKIEKKKAAN